jgi:uncharacterized repeat protein (TIGR03809 family)
MTLRTDVVRSRDLLACWRQLAEKRLAYLTEMFESGRWRRYYSEIVFFENIKEAKIAVETWRKLSTPDPSHNAIIEISWFAPERGTRPRQIPPRPEPSAAGPRGTPSVMENPFAATILASSLDAMPSAIVIDMLALQKAIDQAPEEPSSHESQAPLRSVG